VARVNDLRINRTLARWILLGVGVVALIVMAVALLAAPMNAFDTYSYVALGVAILGLAGFVLLDPQALVTSLTGRTSQYGTTTVLMSLFFIVFVVAIFVIVRAAKITPWDLTAVQKYKLSQQSIDILSKLTDDIHVVGFYSDQSADQRKDAEIWLQEYEKYSNGKLTYEFVDPDRNPGMAAQLKMTRANVMVFSQGDQTAEASSADESSMTGALVRVMSGETRKLYMVVGHGERSTDDFNQTGYSQIKDTLTKVGFEIASLNLLEQGSVPDDASLVVVAGPTAQFAPKEVDALKAYLAGGGAALFMFDPASGGGQFGNGLTGVAFNNDGSLLATAGADGVIRIWKVSNFQQVLELRGHTSDIWDVAFSPDGKQIASAGRDGTVRVWNASSGEQVKQLDGQTEGVRRLAYSPDGRLLASVGSNQVLNVWNAKTYEPMSYSPISVPLPLYVVIFSPDSSLIAAGGGAQTTSGTSEGPVYIWKAKDGEEVLDKTLHTNIVYDLAFSPDGATLHSVALDGTEGTIDVASGEGSTETLYPSQGITGLAIEEDGTELFSLTDGTVHMRPPDATSTDQDVVLTGHTDVIWAMRLSPDGKSLVTGSRDGSARLWDLTVSPPTSRETTKAQGGGDPLLDYLRDTWGIQVDDDVIVDMTAPQDALTPYIFTFDKTSPIVQSFQNYVIFTVARSVESVDTPPAGITLTELLFSSSAQNGQIASWGETEAINSQPSYDPTKDLVGPLSLGVSAEDANTRARVVVFGDADFASNATMNQYLDSDLMLNAANWLTESQNLLNIPVKDVGSHTMTKPLSQAGLIVVYITSICLIPLIGLGAGAAVFFVRRRRR
jgi:WD40 repeat protein